MYIYLIKIYVQTALRFTLRGHKTEIQSTLSYFKCLFSFLVIYSIMESLIMDRDKLDEILVKNILPKETEGI